MDALLQVGWNKGEIDFGVRGDIISLTLDEMNKFRAMTVVAIGTMEDMWRRHQESLRPPQSGKTHQPMMPPDEAGLRAYLEGEGLL